MKELKYLKIGKTLDSMIELKQLWYGLDEDYEPIIDKEDFFPKYNEVYSTYSCENHLGYASEPERDLQFDLHDENIDIGYLPTATFSLPYVNADVYSEIAQIINTKAFYIGYYDYEIMQDVVRYVYKTDFSHGDYFNIKKDLLGIRDVKFTVVSRIGYTDYEDLKKKTSGGSSKRLNFRVMIEPKKDKEEHIDQITINAEKNNISGFENGDYSNSGLNDDSFLGSNPFLLGYSKLSPTGDVFSSQYKGLISYKKSDENGNIEDFVINIKGNKMKKIEICFDSVADEYATEFTINDVLYRNENAIFETFFEETNDLEIKLLGWNKGNSYIRIAHITLGDYIILDKKNGLLEMTRGHQIMDDNSTKPYYSLIGGYGNFRIKYSEALKQLIENGSIDNTSKVMFYINNNKIGTYYINEFNKAGNDILNIECKDPILRLQDITTQRLDFGDRRLQQLVINPDFTRTYGVFEMIELYLREYHITFNANLISNIVNALSKANETVTKYCYIEESNAWDLLTYLCQIAQMNITSDENGELVGYEI